MDDGSRDTRTDERGVDDVNTDVIQRSKLRVDTRKWLMSKLHAQFADKQTLHCSGSTVSQQVIHTLSNESGIT